MLRKELENAKRELARMENVMFQNAANMDRYMDILRWRWVEVDYCHGCGGMWEDGDYALKPCACKDKSFCGDCSASGTCLCGVSLLCGDCDLEKCPCGGFYVNDCCKDEGYETCPCGKSILCSDCVRMECVCGGMSVKGCCDFKCSCGKTSFCPNCEESALCSCGEKLVGACCSGHGVTACQISDPPPSDFGRPKMYT